MLTNHTLMLSGDLLAQNVELIQNSRMLDAINGYDIMFKGKIEFGRKDGG